MPTDATLTKNERNTVFYMIQHRTLDPAEFDWTAIQSAEWSGFSQTQFTVSQLVHRATGYYFAFGGYSVTACPGKSRKVESQPHNDDWELRAEQFDEWLKRLIAEVEAPDLWASIGQEKALAVAASSPNLDNSSFTQNELSLISKKLDEIKRYLIDGQHFDAEQAVIIEREFAYLKESSQRLGRKDWLNALLGGLMGLVFTVVLETEKARGLLAMAGTAFQSLWSAAQPFLQ